MDKVQAVEALRNGIKALADGDNFKKYLEFRSKFHAYSFRNAMMISLQCPTASHVAGFNKWKELGRFVKKGEKGIAILAPMVFTKKDETTGDKSKSIGGFKIAHVFDIAQTDGQPIPEVGLELLQGDDGSDVFECLQDFAQHGGLTVLPSFDAFPDERNGDYSPSEKQIRIKAGLSNLQKAKTLAHECAHWVLHTSPEGSALAREVKETEAEATAFLVLARLGYRSDTYSFPYLVAWAGGDVKILEASLSRIEKATEEILHAVESRIGELTHA